MKALLLISLALISLNIFAASEGEDQKGECPYSPQTSKREGKIVVETTDVKEDAPVLSVTGK